MGLGLGTSVIVLMFIISFALYLGTPPPHTSSVFFSWMGGTLSYTSLLSSLTVAIGIAAASGIVAFTLGRDVLTPLIVSVSGFLLTMVAIPLDVLNEATLPSEFRVLLVGVFGLLYIMAMASFIRGSGGSP